MYQTIMMYISNTLQFCQLYFTRASLVAQMVKNPPVMQETWEWLPTSVFWPREFHGQRSLAGSSTVYGIAKSQTQLSNFDITSLGYLNKAEKKGKNPQYLHCRDLKYRTF